MTDLGNPEEIFEVEQAPEPIPEPYEIEDDDAEVTEPQKETETVPAGPREG